MSGSVKVVGSSHVSEESVEVIKDEISNDSIDTVAVELDEDRYESIQGQEVDTDEDVTLDSFVKGKNLTKKIVVWSLSFYQNKIAETTGVDPGTDMITAINVSEEEGKNVELIDRDLDITVNRIVNNITFLEILKFFAYSIYFIGYIIKNGMPKMEEIGSTEDFDVSEHPEQEQVDEITETMRSFSPSFAEVFLDERNKYMAIKLEKLRREGKNVVAIVGAAHKKGIEEELQKIRNQEDFTEDLIKLNDKKEKRFDISYAKVIGYSFSLLVVALFGLLLLGGASSSVVITLVFAWVLINGIPVYLSTRFVGAKRISSSIGFSLAWMTSINPALAPGWFVGISEIKHRTDLSVNDVEKINEKLKNPEGSSLKETLISLNKEVPLFNVISIIAVANIASAIATGVFVLFILPYLTVKFNLGGLITQGFNNLTTIIGL